MKRPLYLLCATMVVLATFRMLSGCEMNPMQQGNTCATGGTAGGSTTVSYKQDILPILNKAGCMTSACHGGAFPSSNYDQRTYASAFVAGDDAKRLGACEIVPGHPESSFFYEKVSTDSPRVGLRMPQEHDPLTPAQISLIATWIREGAQDN